MTSRSEDDVAVLIHAYADGELDPANSLAIEEQIEKNPAFSAEYARIKAYQQLMRDHFPRGVLPPGLRERIEASVASRRRVAQPSWRALAASIVVTAVIASGTTSFFMPLTSSDPVREAVVDGHIRSLMAPQPFDVASSDRHTVKPWFNGKIVESPLVVDLAKSGFPLVGGRLDVVGQTAVPTLVYGHAKHLISLTAVPATAKGSSEAAASSSGGYHLQTWTDNATTYWAISDVGAADLKTFVDAFRANSTDQ